MGYEIDVTSAGSIQKSLETINDPEARFLLELLARKANRSAKYYCSGMLDIAKYSHYALNVPLYSHFTSPIRRYADILVHRQLESIVAGTNATEPKFTMDRDSVAKIAQQCNMCVYIHAYSTLNELLTFSTASASRPSWLKSSRRTYSCAYYSRISLLATAPSFAKRA